MKKHKIVLLSLLTSCLIVLGGTLVVFSQGLPRTEICNGIDDNSNGAVDEVNCEHYLSYLIDKNIQPTDIVLKDQFIEPTDFQITLIERLLNPVKKTHDGLTFNIKRPDLHYLAYRLKSFVPFTPQTVFIENQFEKRTVTAIEPRYLLTPTGKKKIGIPIEKILATMPPSAAERLIAVVVPPVPQNANHYLCYDVEPYDMAEGVVLKDQFQRKGFEAIRAKYLCNPVQKTHDEKTYEIIDENNHLMCYEVVPNNTVNRKVITRDQFGFRSLTAVRTEEVCLPTVKTQLPKQPPECVLPDGEGSCSD